MKTRKYSSVITESFKATISGKIWKWLLGSVSASGFVFLIGHTAFDLTYLNSFLAGLYFLVGLFIVRFLFALSTRTSQYLRFKWRESIYGDAIILLKDAFADIHQLRKKDFEAQEFMEVMIGTCLKLKEIFDNQTKCNCSVSIKVGLGRVIDAGATVKNLCRDTPASKIRDTTPYINTKHTVIGNTPFQTIVSRILSQKEKTEKTYYLNNDISSHGDYLNSSKEAYTNRILPYKSEIVVPILPLCRQIPNKHDLLGFICVDCEMPHKFIDELYSAAILEGVADGLYDVIDKYIKMQENENNSNAAKTA